MATDMQNPAVQGGASRDLFCSTSHEPLSAFTSPRHAALALLCDADARLTRKAGSFLGQCVADDRPLSPAQSDWLAILIERAGLPPTTKGNGHD